MSKFSKLAAGAAIGLALASVPALAAEHGFTGNVGVVSEYLFRGVDTSDGMGVQGGVDWESGMGLYAGGWASNTAGLTSGNEFDGYVGFAGALADFGFDVGAIYYLYLEDEEAGTLTPGGEELDYYEVYVGASVGPIAAKVYGTNDFSGTDEDALYATANVSLPLNDTISFGLSAGFSAGDGVEAMFGDEYVDYSVSVTKKLREDIAATFAVVGTDRDLTETTEDKPKVVVGLKKTFDVW